MCLRERLVGVELSLESLGGRGVSISPFNFGAVCLWSPILPLLILSPPPERLDFEISVSRWLFKPFRKEALLRRRASSVPSSPSPSPSASSSSVSPSSWSSSHAPASSSARLSPKLASTPGVFVPKKSCCDERLERLLWWNDGDVC